VWGGKNLPGAVKGINEVLIPEHVRLRRKAKDKTLENGRVVEMTKTHSEARGQLGRRTRKRGEG